VSRSKAVVVVVACHAVNLGPEVPPGVGAFGVIIIIIIIIIIGCGGSERVSSASRRHWKRAY
jgi:hypothetical protein